MIFVYYKEVNEFFRKKEIDMEKISIFFDNICNYIIECKRKYFKVYVFFMMVKIIYDYDRRLRNKEK